MDEQIRTPTPQRTRAERLAAVLRRWQARHAAGRVLELAAQYEATQPSLAQDLRAAADLALDGRVGPTGASRAADGPRPGTARLGAASAC